MTCPARVVYIALWFPKASETFVFHEVEGLHKRGFPIFAVALFGPYLQIGWRAIRSVLTKDMQRPAVPIERLGVRALLRVSKAVVRHAVRDWRKFIKIVRLVLWRRWRVKSFGENLWAFLCGFYLAELFVARGVSHIHAAWATGPTTAAWVVHLLTGIPFSFFAHAGDVRPQDGALTDKLRAAAFARGNASYLIPYLASFCPANTHVQIELVYNSRTFPVCSIAPVPMRSPLQLLAIGRFVETKGFQFLINALQILQAQAIQAELTLVGSGAWWGRLHAIARDCGVEQWVRFPGFMPHDRIPALLCAADIFVMPSIVHARTQESDGLPTVIVEAMFHGVPVIGTDVASIGDVVKNDETGILIPQRDAKAIATAVQRLAKNREGTLRMTERARALVQTMFDPDSNQGRLMELFCAHAHTGKKN